MIMKVGEVKIREEGGGEIEREETQPAARE